MAYHQNPNPQLGATFVPGGFDDYYMPNTNAEVVSPAPQRLMPEVPEQMQDSIARLELDANQSPRGTAAHHLPTSPHTTNSSQSFGGQNMLHNGYGQGQPSPGPGMASAFPPQSANTTQPPAQGADYRAVANLPDIPNFTPFPRLENRPANVPPSDEEKESILESARNHVLNSNDPEMQLAWAQDALAYVDSAMTHEERVSQTEPARSVTPAVEHQLRVDAMNVVNFLADQHHPKAEFLRGMWLEFGKFGLRMDKREAFRSYSRAAEKGYWRAEYRIGMQFEQSNDAVKALQHYKRGSEMGDSASNYRLGMMTLLGQHSQPQDYAKGVQLIRQAAATADENAPQGAYVLGMLQARELPQVQVPEIFLPYSEKDARVNIERAAFLGFMKAQLKMGQAYELCSLGCEFSPKLSLHYNALAARQGELEADMAISKWFLCGYEGLFAKNEELAFMHAHRAAQGGLATAEFAMGYFHEIGMHVSVNLDKAMEWYEKAARNGNKDAEGRIEGLSKSRALSKKDHEDVAINRIRSQYGSKRGQRPDRFKQRDSSNLPSLNEVSPSVYSQDAPTSPHNGRPERLNTTTPYPMSNGPPQIAPMHPMSPTQRPSTAAPYPMGDGPPGGLGPPAPGNFLNPELRSASAAPASMQRPSSAFQINPNIYQNDGRRPGPQQSPGYGNAGLPPRAASTTYGESNSPYGGPGGRQPNGRNASGPPQGSFGGPQGGYGPGPGGPGGPGGRMPGPDGYSRPQPGDPGYQAPLDIRKQRPGTNPPQGGPPPGHGLGYEAPLPQKQQVRPADRPGSARPVGAQPLRMDSRPIQSGTSLPRPEQSSQPGPGGPPRRDTTPAVQQKPVSTSTPKPSPAQQPQKTSAGAPPKPGAGKASATAAGAKPGTPASTASSRPPGMGPKTFDDMGVPKVKQDSDCIVM